MWLLRHTDSIPEAAMHVGVWFMMMGLGWFFGIARGGTEVPMMLLAIGGVLGIAGQLTVELNGTADDPARN